MKKMYYSSTLIPHYRIKLFQLIDNDLKGKVYFGFNYNSKKSIFNDNSAFKLSSINIRWIKFGPIIINPDF